MNNFETIKSEWTREMDRLSATPWFARLEAGDVTIAHYKAFLRETYFNARENPPLQALATAYFKGAQRSVTKMFYQHAIQEIGHDQLALNDLAALGENVGNIPNERPLASTVAFTAFGFYQVQFINPLGYLGYLFHLEFMPTRHGHGYLERLISLGAPPEALTFLEEHAKVDVHHNRMMEKYVDALVKTNEDLAEVIWAARTACQLHGKMIVGAFENTNKNT